MSKTELKTKTAASKTKAAPKGKAAAKAASKPTLFYGMTLVDALTGKYGPLIQRFYLRAMEYHGGCKTTFPRARLIGHPLLKVEEVKPWLLARTGTSIPAGDKTGQRLFDEMMVELAKMPKIKVEPKVKEPVKAPAPELVGPPAPAPTTA